MTGSPTSSERPYPAVDIIEFFKTRSSLVVAAVAALDAMPAELARLKLSIGTPNVGALDPTLKALDALIQRARIGPDNLLVSDPRGHGEPFVICSVTRQPSGAVDVRTIELDREALALTDAVGRSRPMDALTASIQALKAEASARNIAAAKAAVDVLLAQIRTAVSRLSIVKARLDLQQSFLSSVMESDTPSSPVRLGSHLDQAGARDMAMEARRLLSSRSFNIASGNKKTLTSLFESHAVQGLARAE